MFYCSQTHIKVRRNILLSVSLSLLLLLLLFFGIAFKCYFCGNLPFSKVSHTLSLMNDDRRSRRGSREGRFLSAHLDLLSAASSLFPSLMSRHDRVDLLETDSDLSHSQADKLVATQEDLSESDTIRGESRTLVHQSLNYY